jgi:hypothetical protein
VRRSRPILGTIAVNPARLKWCAGPCGRQLPAAHFHTNGQGYPQAHCKDCHRIDARQTQRRRYRCSREFREAEKVRAARRYAANRQRICAAERARYLARKLAGAAA